VQVRVSFGARDYDGPEENSGGDEEEAEADYWEVLEVVLKL
jgi:hypothetical protein